MGKTDAGNLSCNLSSRSKQGSHATAQALLKETNVPPACFQDDVDMKTWLVAMMDSLSSIEAGVDNLCSRLDTMVHKLERNDGWSSGSHKLKT
ncbi:hypothetical protein NDU88_005378 [Pleurodeles waltl]|uniref:Uncharacterized protein n=1 Tax=Pleurodeles waltl TaxID=8319 RepID=A0AAV7V7S0_PLEWA|nr:hypothetical protein NDU88_005378 [Pleurodeles waltl]